MKLVSFHADGRVHRRWNLALTTLEPWGFLVPANANVEEGDGRLWSSPFPVAALFWPDRFYQVFLLLKPELTAYYCNVITPPIYDARCREIHFRDLALDVILDERGPRIVDEDEFAEQQASYHPTWVGLARASANELFTLASERQGPFSPNTAERWRALAGVPSMEKLFGR